VIVLKYIAMCKTFRKSTGLNETAKWLEKKSGEPTSAR